jgi:predicted RNase H-like nuclease (RuvC/YqgF family)
MTEQKLSQAERAIEDLANALGITEEEVVSILREGMEAKAPIANQLSRSDEYFISEMEYEYTEHQAHYPSKNEINPLEKTLKKLENDIVILSNYIANVKKVDSVSVENGRVSFYSKLP